MSDDESGPAEDPYLLTLGQIAAELTQIRKELQRLQDRTPDAEARLPEFDCQHCSDTPRGADAAKQHAVDDHGAPVSDWRDFCYE